MKWKEASETRLRVRLGIQNHLGPTTIIEGQNAYAVWSGCRSLGIETKLYSSMRDIEKELCKTFVHAGVPHFTAVLGLLEVPMPVSVRSHR